tara:strand:+ start:97 stop:498 length:402 start_codon:yes stop_codon:yes gene_type:complete
MKNLKEIIKKTKRLPFDKNDTDFFGNYLKKIDDSNLVEMRPDRALKDEGIVEKYLDAYNLGIWVWAIPEASSSFAFVKHSKNKKTIYSIYVKDYEEQNSTWIHKGDNNTLIAAHKYLNDTLKLFNTMMAGLDE